MGHRAGPGSRGRHGTHIPNARNTCSSGAFNSRCAMMLPDCKAYGRSTGTIGAKGRQEMTP